MPSLDQLHLLPPAAQAAILNGPALAPPPGVLPNLTNPPNQNDIGLAVSIICLAVATTAITLAAYAKIRCMKKVELEDYLVFSGYGLTVGVCYCLFESLSPVGFFTHQWNVRVKYLAHFFYIVHAGSILYSVGIMLFKVGILLQWVRLFVPRGTKGGFYWTCHCLLWVNVLLYTTIVITILASCKPFARLWDMTIPGKCAASREVIDVSTAVANLISDLVILVLPQRVIWKLQLKRQKKIGIAFIFLVGIFAIVSASFRVASSYRFLRAEDKTYRVTNVALWAIAELTCAILIFCVPLIPKIFKDLKLSKRVSENLKSWLLSFSSKRTDDGSSPRRFPAKNMPVDSLYQTNDTSIMIPIQHQDSATYIIQSPPNEKFGRDATM
ncbi:hypothetical protein F4778DRAFT_717402 [Xylariomycetidae sp. FL2044]|nr:hypothetical protein F4778DRAFT_717402 [Xylariomycetidae sp. FL2044]